MEKRTLACELEDTYCPDLTLHHYVAPLGLSFPTCNMRQLQQMRLEGLPNWRCYKLLAGPMLCVELLPTKSW